MTEPIHFYFDFSSPYAYLGAMRIDELAKKYGREVDWHPILLGVAFKVTDAKPLINIPIKGDYARMDLVRTAKMHDIPFLLPASLPIMTHQAARAMLWVKQTLGAEKAREFGKKLFSAYFAKDINISEVEPVLKVADSCGIDTLQLANGMISQAIKDQLRQDNEDAIAKGVFGAPFFIVDGESFWGFDRFYQIEALLKNGKN